MKRIALYTRNITLAILVGVSTQYMLYAIFTKQSIDVYSFTAVELIIEYIYLLFLVSYSIVSTEERSLEPRKSEFKRVLTNPLENSYTPKDK
jgi:hypothetical protein